MEKQADLNDAYKKYFDSQEECKKAERMCRIQVAIKVISQYAEDLLKSNKALMSGDRSLDVQLEFEKVIKVCSSMFDMSCHLHLWLDEWKLDVADRKRRNNEQNI